MPRRHAWALTFLLAPAVLSPACVGHAQRASRVGHELSVAETLTGDPQLAVADDVWSNVLQFYRQRESAAAWIENGRLSGQGLAALRVVNQAADDGLVATDYGTATLARMQERLADATPIVTERRMELAQLDVTLTAALLELGRDVALGRAQASSIDPRWNGHRDAPDFVETLTAAAQGRVEYWLDALRPQHPEYGSLQKALADVRNDQEQGGWPTVPAAKFQLHDRNAAVQTLRQRLAASGELATPSGVSESLEYDAELEAAVRAFQGTHGLKTTGLADAATIASMNVPLETRIRQIEINMDRWRWMPDDFGARHILVNVPAFWLTAREHGVPALGMRVVVGKRENATPLFTANMSTVVFSPYWHIPVSIASTETAPAIVKNPSYLTTMNIEVLRVSKAGTSTVDPATIDWQNAASVRGLSLRQRPGAKNALGHVKFLLPNAFDVYLHDTPSESLFSREGRALSHGCVRLDEPAALAAYVLRDDPEWNAGRIDVAMNAGAEKQVELRDSIPVHIVYFTSWVDEQGRLHLVPDVYGYDARQAPRF